MKQKLQILYEDPHIIVCFKPHGIAVQSRRPGQPDLEHMLLNHIAAPAAPGRTGKPYLAIIHRLDQPVSGILVFAKTRRAAAALNRQLTGGDFGKYYLAMTEGIPAKEQETLTDYIVKDGRTNTSRICTRQTAGARQAKLSYRVRSEANELRDKIFPQTIGKSAEYLASCALLEISLDTGRHHQIRVQLAHMGCPIAGDTKYNPNASAAEGWQSIALCAYKLSFRHPISNKNLAFCMSGYPDLTG